MKAVTTQTSQLFAGEVNELLLAQALRVYLGNLRQATARTKTRGEINRSKKKWFKQKGTGNARHGARTPALFVGGGVAHGPTGEQNYSRRLTSKMKRGALCSALLAQKEHVFIDDAVVKMDGKTKTAVKALGDQLDDRCRILLLVDECQPLVMRAYNNLQTVYVTTSRRVNALQVANADTIVMTTAALQDLEKRLVKTVEEK